jgi:hypothetical protein
LSQLFLLLVCLCGLLGCTAPDDSDLDGDLALPRGLTLRVIHKTLAAGDTLRLYLDSPDSLRRCLVEWDAGGAGDFLLPLNPDSMQWCRPAGAVTDPEFVTLRVRVSDGEQEWRDSVAVTVLEGWPGRISFLPLRASRVRAEGRIAVLATDDLVNDLREAYVVDLSNQLETRLIATIPKDHGRADLQLELPRLYLSCGFHILDLELPQSPLELGHVDTLGFEASVVDGDHVYGSRSGYLYRLDISDPAHWRIESMLPGWMHWGGGHSLELVDQTLIQIYDWDGDNDGGRVVRLIDLRDPDQPVAGGWTGTSYDYGHGIWANQIGNVLLRDGWLYVPNGCLHVFRVDEDRQLQEAAAPEAIRAGFVFDAGPGRLLCVAVERFDDVMSVQLVDVADPSQPTILREGSLPGSYLRDVTRMGDYLLVLTSAGLHIIWAPVS